MTHHTTRSILFASLIVAAPWLLGADGGGCGKSSHPSAPDAGAAAGSGGTHAQAGAEAGKGPAQAGTSPAQAGASGRAGAGTSGSSGAGACVAKRGEHCGGNIKEPCRCASGLSCKRASGGPAPGDVGGVCEPTSEEDAGMACVSDEGGVCGGNTNSPCTCAAGLTCKSAPGSTLPFGDVGGTCQRSSTEHACMSDADCSLMADYCTGCDCVALAKGESIKPCSGPGIRCLVDPCRSKTAQCVSGRCEAR